jgi:indole-3-glycerol phosphate synthase
VSRSSLEAGFLSEMARASRRRARRLVAREGRAAIEHRARASPAPPPLRLAPDGFDLVAEVKFVSPASGALGPAPSARRAAAQARRYARAGAVALSVLTEPTRFGGSAAHLRAATRAVAVPVLRKDFLVDPVQVHEARGCGASGVLLVLRLLDSDALAELFAAARACGLFVLLEAFDERDLERAAEALARPSLPQVLVGVNARDLRTLAVVPGRHRALADYLPRGVPCVAESGLTTPRDARAAAEAGYRLALVGSALMRAADPLATARAFLADGRAGARQRSDP